ncbi:hypothetical protein ACOCIZ_17155 [Acinetobacter baumannii]|uniref:hypothetical protein n=1 Tax=Acinetobacter baumannii TaxID=470 RepID=UPI00359FD23F
MKDEELRKLCTIEGFLNYMHLPNTFREGWSPSYSLHFEELGIGEDEQAHVYISLNGKIKKSKCEFIQDKVLADKFVKYIEPKLKKNYPSIRLNLRHVECSDLDYRRKTALNEAKVNDLKILEYFKTK